MQVDELTRGAVSLRMIAEQRTARSAGRYVAESSEKDDPDPKIRAGALNRLKDPCQCQSSARGSFSAPN